MIALTVGCSILLLISLFSGVESLDASIEKPKKQDNSHDVSVYFRPMLGKREKYFVPRLGKREEEEDSPYLLWDTDKPDATGENSVDPKYEPDIHHPMIFRYYTPRLGKRETYFTPRLGKKNSYYTPRLGKRTYEAAASPFSPRLGKRGFGDTSCPLDSEDAHECEVFRERRKANGEKAWKVIGVYNPRLGRSVPYEMAESDISKDYILDESERE